MDIARTPTHHAFRKTIIADLPVQAAIPRTREPLRDLQLFAMTFVSAFLAFLGYFA